MECSGSLLIPGAIVLWRCLVFGFETFPYIYKRYRQWVNKPSGTFTIKPSAIDAMSLTACPAEIWLEIMSHLDSQFFANDVGRLAVSRLWYPIAQRIAWRDVRLGPRTLRTFIAHFSDKTAIEKLGPHLRTLTLDLKKAPDVLEYITALESFDVKHKWYGQLSVDLLDLRRILEHCPDLRSYSFQSGSSINFTFIMPQLNASSQALASLPPCLEHLSCLEVDTRRNCSDFDRIHICPVIEHMLPRLQCLRAHLDGICSNALIPPTTGFQRLKNVEIKLGDVESSQSVVPVRLAVVWNQEHTATAEFWEFARTIRQTAHSLVRSMREPTMVHFTFPAPFMEDNGSTYLCYNGLTQRSTIAKLARPSVPSVANPDNENPDELDQDHCSITPFAYLEATYQRKLTTRQVLSGLFSLSTSLLLGALLFGHRALEIAFFQKLVLYLVACSLYISSLAMNGCFTIIRH
ncbi:hypothetical protein KEM54_005496 [Ascosphaera aggregata]|nr:hypothetical protein KEM54_005496 [Ascosphaera aggregata]